MKYREKLIFLNGLPMLIPEHNAVRQLKVEIWLNAEHTLSYLEEQVKEKTKEYIV